MINLCIKDFCFTKKWCLFSALYAILVPFIILIDGDSKFYFANILIPFISVSLPLGKILLIENDESIREFIRLMPYKSSERIGARYLYILIMFSISEVYLWIINNVIFKTNFMTKTNMITMFIFLCYFSVYLFCFYYKNYYIAQNCIYIILFLLMAISFVTKKLNVDTGSLTSIKMEYIYILLLSVTVIMYYWTIQIEGKKRTELNHKL